MNSKFLCAVFIGVLATCLNAAAVSGNGDSNVGIIDTTVPEFLITGVHPPVATLGDLITITVTATKPLGAAPRVTVNGHLAAFAGEEGGVYTYVYRIQIPDPSGPATIVVRGADPLGNTGTETDTALLALDMPPVPLSTGLAFLIVMIALAASLRRVRKAPAALLLAALLVMPAAVAQEPVVSNVTFVQQAVPRDGTEVVITYDLESGDELCNITVLLSKDAGADGFPYSANSISGDVTKVDSGTGKRIVWDVAADYPNEYIAQAQLRVTATVVEKDYSAWEAEFPAWIWAYAASCENNMKELGLVIEMFWNESIGHWAPRLSNENGVLMFREDEVYPEYLNDTKILRCPGRVEDESSPLYDDGHYLYLGYLLTCDQDVTAFAEAYANEIAAGGDFSTDLPGNASYGNTIYRLRRGIEIVLIPDINDPQYESVIATIPLMFEWPDNHQQGWGGNVLYLDGHVDFQRYPGEFPMTETTISTLANLAGYMPPTQWRVPDPDDPYSATNDPYDFLRNCSNNFAHLGLACRAFSVESADDFYPPLSTESGSLIMREESIYPEYLVDDSKLRCPGVPEGEPPPHFDDRDYLYWGYLLLNDSDVAVFATAYAEELAGGGDFLGDLPGMTSYGETIYRLQQGIEGYLTKSINASIKTYVADSQVPVMLEWPDNHEGRSGGHVLYLDGHTEWHDFPGEFPMSEAAINIFGGLANRVPKTDWADPNPVYLPEYDTFGFTADCLEQVRELRLALAMFANENVDEAYPMLSEVPGLLMFTETEMFPRGLSDPGTLICPGPAAVSPEPYFDDQHYVYLGYVVTCDDDVDSFVSAYTAEMAGGRDLSGDLPGTVSYGTGDTIYRLSEADGSPPIIEMPSGAVIGMHEIPVLIEWPDHHEGFSGGHVAYWDGHVEWLNYPGKWPMTEHTINALDGIAGWLRTTAWATRDFSPSNDPYKQSLCNQNMKSLWASMVCFDYPDDHYPKLSNVSGTLMFMAEEMRPYYLDDVRRLNCPGSQEAFDSPQVDDHNYVYLGYIVLNEADLQSFAAAHTAELAGGGDFSGDLPGAVSYGDGNQVLRLHHELWNVAIPDHSDPDATYIGAHKIPVMMEWPDNHGSIRGGNVLYLNGHVEWLEYPSRFPMTEAAMDVLTTLAGRPPIE